MNWRWNENSEIKEREGVSFQCAVILSLLISSVNVLGLSYRSAFADTAEEVSCDALYFPLEDSRAANNSVAKNVELKSVLSSGYRSSLPLFSHPHMAHLPILEFAFQIVHQED